jgi:biotin transport system substrate-specific component
MEQSISIRRKATVRLTLVALFAALIAAGTFISIPVPFSPVPVVLQNLFALLSGVVLGPVLGGAAVGLYLIAGILGAPVFTGASGGIAHLLKPSAGYLGGYFLAAVVAGLIVGTPEKKGKKGKKTPVWRIIVAVVAGLLVVYVPGVIRLKFAMDVSWPAAIIAGFVPFIVGDAIKGFVAVIIATRLRTVVADVLG